MEFRKSRMENLEIMKELIKTYSGKRVFVTGHTGFKGSWLIKTLNILGAKIRGYSLPPENDINLYMKIKGDDFCDSIISDLRDKEALKNALLDFQPDFVFHLAAQPLVRLSYQIPSETFEVNAIGTANLLDAVKLLEGQCNVVLITTDKVYHNYEWEFPYRENDRLGGYDPYSASKACCELIIDSYKNSFFNLSKYATHKKSISIARAGNVIGGGDWSTDRLLPDIVKSLYGNREIVLRNPNSTRPWQHVIEPIVGYLLLAQKQLIDPLNYSQSFNFGPNYYDTLTVEEVVKKSIQLWGNGKFVINNEKGQPHEALQLRLDISKAIQLLNWKPKFDAEQALSNTINWYKSFYSNPDSVNELTSQEINDYLKMI
jgi:CDP-glucose 4,6-dehydratase